MFDYKIFSTNVLKILFRFLNYTFEYNRLIAKHIYIISMKCDLWFHVKKYSQYEYSRCFIIRQMIVQHQCIKHVICCNTISTKDAAFLKCSVSNPYTLYYIFIDHSLFSLVNSTSFLYILSSYNSHHPLLENIHLIPT